MRVRATSRGPLIASSARAIVVPPVEIDYGTAGRLAGAIADVLASGAQTVVVDYTNVTFCDSSGLRVLVQAAKLARATGGAFVVHNPTRPLLRLAELLGASDLLGLPPPP